MKKIALVSAVLAVICLFAGIVVHFVMQSKNKKPELELETEKTEVHDVLNADGMDDLKKLADEEKVELEETPENDNEMVANGYSIASVPLDMTITKNDAGEILSFEGYGSLFSEGEKPTATQYREKITQVIKEFSARFNVSPDQYEIFEINGNEGTGLSITEDASYQRIVDGKAELTFLVKDNNGDVWMLRSKYDKIYNTTGIEIRRITDPAITKDISCNVDLSQTQTQTEGN